MDKDFDLLHVRIVGFSGRQNLRDASGVAQELRRQLEKMQAPGHRLMALSPLSGPTDLIFAKEAVSLGLPLIVLLPRPPEEARKSLSAEAAIDFDLILQKAVKLEVLLLAAQVEAATRVGQKLVDETDILLALSDDSASASAGDTAEVIAYATRRGRPVILLRETAEGINVREIKTEKDLDQPELTVDQLELMLGSAPAKPILPDGLLKYFHACDTAATKAAPRVRRYVLDIVLANAIASVAGSVGSSFPHSPFIGTTLTVIKFSCIFLGLGIFAVLRHRQSRSQWLKLRLKAEVCRSAIATWHSPIVVEPLTSDEVPELHQLIQALRYFRATHHRQMPNLSLEDFKAEYGVHRLVDQYRYFQRQAQSAKNMSTRLSPVYWVLSGSALVISGISLFIPASFGHHAPFERFLNFFIIMIPVIAPAFASWIIAWQAIESVSRKQARFVEMERLMHQALVDLIHCHSWEAVQHVVKRAERQLLGEVLEWYSFVKYS
jgi:hypothetical protein